MYAPSAEEFTRLFVPWYEGLRRGNDTSLEDQLAVVLATPTLQAELGMVARTLWAMLRFVLEHKEARDDLPQWSAEYAKEPLGFLKKLSMACRRVKGGVRAVVTKHCVPAPLAPIEGLFARFEGAAAPRCPDRSTQEVPRGAVLTAASARLRRLSCASLGYVCCDIFGAPSACELFNAATATGEQPVKPPPEAWPVLGVIDELKAREGQATASADFVQKKCKKVHLDYITGCEQLSAGAQRDAMLMSLLSAPGMLQKLDSELERLIAALESEEEAQAAALCLKLNHSENRAEAAWRSLHEASHSHPRLTVDDPNPNPNPDPNPNPRLPTHTRGSQWTTR